MSAIGIRSHSSLDGRTPDEAYFNTKPFKRAAKSAA